MERDFPPPLPETEADAGAPRLHMALVSPRSGAGNGSTSTLYYRVLEAIDGPLFVFSCDDEHQSIVYANPAFERWSGCTSAELAGRDWRSVTGSRAGETELERVNLRIEAGSVAHALLRGHDSVGNPSWTDVQFAPLPNQPGSRRQYVVQLRDVTAEMSEREQLRQRALHDSLTGLPNRHLLLDRLEQAIANARAGRSGCAVAFLDLDRFKQVNDHHGHQVGDELLRQVARRLSRGVGDGDIVARLYGDEFVLILAPASMEEIAETISRRVADWLRRPFVIRGRSIAISCSVGVACFHDGADGEQLIASADLDMYRRKRLSRFEGGS